MTRVVFRLWLYETGLVCALHAAVASCFTSKTRAVQDYKRPRELVRERPTPMFGYNSAEGYWDIPFPDFTFYGHEHSWLVGEG